MKKRLYLNSITFSLAAILHMFSYQASAANIYVGSDPVQCNAITFNSALAQATATPESDVIYLTQATNTNDINLNIADQSVTIIGGHVNCADAAAGNAASGKTTLTGQVGGADSVLEVLTTNNNPHQNVSIQNLNLVGGEDDPDGGGGLDINGDVSVLLINSTIANNSSRKGGGISLVANGGAKLYLLDSLVFGNNSTGAGGGIYCTGFKLGTSEVIIENSTIQNNSASSIGGGLIIENSCRAEIYSRENSDVAEFSFNSTNFGNGGGIYVGASSFLKAMGYQDASGTIFPSAGPVLLTNNSSAGIGGALFVDTTGFAEISGITVDSNQAVSGAGIGLFGGASIYKDTSCPKNAACNMITNNTDGGAAASFGGGLFISSNGGAGTPFVFAENMDIRGNDSSTGSGVYLNHSTLEIKNSFIVENTGGSSIVEGQNQAHFDATFVTISHNQDMTDIIRMDGSELDLNYDIVYQFVPVLGSAVNPVIETNPSAAFEHFCVATHTDQNYPIGVFNTVIVVADPGYVNAGTGDFNLSETSIVSDLCIANATSNLFPRDINGVLRNNENPNSPSMNIIDPGASAVHADYYLVGDTSTDFDCEFDTVQEAADASEARNITNYLSIRLSNNQNYLTQEIVLSGAKQKLIGGYQNCSNARQDILTDPLVKTVLDGTGGNVNPVIAIDPFDGLQHFYTLENLEITGGEGEGFGEFGGGVYIAQNSSVIISDSYIHHNAVVNDGGGVFINADNDANLSFFNTNILFNTAGRNGGGIALTDSADNSSRISYYSGGVNSNTAIRGGGIYMGSQLITSDPHGLLLLTPSNGQAVSISNNIANQDGGGIYIGTSYRLETSGTTSISSNDATNHGGGIYIDSQPGNQSKISSEINGNTAQNGAGITLLTGNLNISYSDVHANVAQQKGGGLWTESDDALIEILNAQFHSNSAGIAGSAIAISQNDTELTIKGSMFYKNTGGESVIDQLSFLNTDYSHITVSENSFALAAINNTSPLHIRKSIIWEQTGQEILGIHIVGECVMVHNPVSLNGLGGVDNIVVADPFFADPQGSDFHLTADSIAIDYCDDPVLPFEASANLKASRAPIDDVDIDGDLRGFDNPSVPNRNGPFDLGADSANDINADILFSDGFEG